MLGGGEDAEDKWEVVNPFFSKATSAESSCTLVRAMAARMLKMNHGLRPFTVRRNRISLLLDTLRIARAVVVGFPPDITQTGNYGQRVFEGDDAYPQYLEWLQF